jgi:hypothetical protein
MLHGCSFPSSAFCETTAPNAKSEASVSRIAGASGSKCCNMGAVVNLLFNRSNTVSASLIQLNRQTFFNRFVSGVTVLLKFSMKRL